MNQKCEETTENADLLMIVELRKLVDDVIRRNYGKTN